MEPTSQSTMHKAVPVAIVAGFALVALAVYFNTSQQAPAKVPVLTATSSDIMTGSPRPVDQSDNIRGNPNAPIVMIEYSDYECPFCKRFHGTLSQIMDEYGVGGKVAWVYRQFPIGQLHPNAPKISEAALCVNDLGGNDKFWDFSDLVFEEREETEFTNMLLLEEYAVRTGIDKDAFSSCLKSGKMSDKVKASLEDGFNIGVRGTPYTIIMVGNETAVINGGQSYDTVKSIVSNLITQLEGGLDQDVVVEKATTTPR